MWYFKCKGLETNLELNLEFSRFGAQLLKVVDYFAKGLENKTQIDCISLDFQRAFDIVPQERLLLKTSTVEDRLQRGPFITRIRL